MLYNCAEKLWINTQETMSEYIKIETDLSDDGQVLFFHTNLPLTDGSVESYISIEAMEEGSPIAQALAAGAGLSKINIQGSEMRITKTLDVEWYVVVEEVTAILKDFFL